MIKVLAASSAAALLAGASASAQTMEISENHTRETAVGPAETFTGQVLVKPLFAANDPMTTSGGEVIFAPGARSAWHTHPAGQVLVVTHGAGWVQEEGGAKRLMRPGDVIWTPPGVKHWHGATDTTSVTHIALQQHEDGTVVEWMELVSDAEYGAPIPNE